MILYLDTSSMLKLFVSEAGSEKIHERAVKANALVTSQIAFVEALAGIARRHRDRGLRKADFGPLVRAFEDRWRSFLPIAVDEVAAGHLALKHPLRGMDAIHLAAALAARSIVRDEELVFSSFDQRLNAAAAAEGLRVAE